MEDQLQIDGIVEAHADHHAHGQGRRQDALHHGRVLQDARRDQGFPGHAEAHGEQHPEHGRRHIGRPGRRHVTEDADGAGTAGIQGQHGDDGSGGHQARAQPVDLVRPFEARQLEQGLVDDPQRYGADRQVDPEDRRPMHLLGDKPAQYRAAQRRGGEDRGEIALQLGALSRRDDVGNHRLDQRHQPAAAQPLNGPGDNQEQHALRKAAQRRARQEDGDGEQQRGAAADDIGEFAVERRHHRGRQQIGRDDPRHVLDIAQHAADGRQGRCDDRLVERRQQHDHHQADDDGARVLGIERRRRGAVVRGVLGGVGHKACPLAESL